MLTGKSDFYLGIDLGTTNSVISWGSINRRRKELDTQVISIPMMIEGGGMGNKELLPSHVYFAKGSSPIVGEYAKTMIGRQTSRVVKSVKSHMGTQDSFNFDGKEYDPAQVSAMILKHLGSSAREINIEPEEVVITVPASFDSDQRSATIKAGELAGFHVTLFDEPRAALYDFAHRQEKGELPATLIDFDDPKFVLVFDLGGGTLDVSLHKVYYEQDQHELTIDDIAIGRYTKLGGDDFDALLADHFLEAYSNRLPQNPNDYDMHLLESEFQVYAEIAKIELSRKVTLEIQQGNKNWNSDDISTVVIQAPSINPNQLFQYSLTLTEYEQIVEPLLASNLSLDAVDKFASMPFENNIIYPILDVLRKAKNQLDPNTKLEVDAVLLNGGMTRLYTIRKRLETFFGIPPIIAGEPDKAVARGASVYHYRLSEGHKLTRILNDTIGIEIDGGKVRPLVEVGTILPLHKPTPIEGYSVPAGASRLRLPFYLGSREDTSPPNRKILERLVKFEEPMLKDESIFLQATVDDQGILEVEGWLKSKPEEKFSVSVDYGKQDSDSETEIREQEESLSDKPKPEISSVETLGISSELELLNSKCSQYMNTDDVNRKNTILDQISRQRSRISLATNASDFVKPLINSVNSIKTTGYIKNFLDARIMILLGDLAPHCLDSDLLYDICETAIMLSDPEKPKDRHPKVINTVVRYAIEAIGKTRIPQAEQHLIKFLNRNYEKMSSIRSNAIYSIGKCCNTVNAVKHLEPLIRSGTEADRIAANWSLGKIGSRENENPIPINSFNSTIHTFQGQLIVENHNQAKQHIIYALGEICDRRNSTIDIVPEEIADSVIGLLDVYKRPPLGQSLSDLVSMKQQQILQPIAEVAIQMIKGNELSSDQQTSLLTIRGADY